MIGDERTQNWLVIHYLRLLKREKTNNATRVTQQDRTRNEVKLHSQSTLPSLSHSKPSQQSAFVSHASNSLAQVVTGSGVGTTGSGVGVTRVQHTETTSCKWRS